MPNDTVISQRSRHYLARTYLSRFEDRVTICMGSREYIGGTPIDVTSFDEVIEDIIQAVRLKVRFRIHTLNVDHVVLASQSPQFYDAIRTANRITPDGMPLVWILRKRGWRASRITGIDMAERLLGMPSLRIAIVGGRPGVAAAAAEQVYKWRDHANIVLTISPSREEIESKDLSLSLVKTINDSHPDILFLSLGSPRQELWLQNYEDQLMVAVRIGVGAAVDFLAGNTKRAPVIMREHGLEWLYRLVTDPVRLGQRYIGRDWKFVPLVVRHGGKPLIVHPNSYQKQEFGS